MNNFNGNWNGQYYSPFQNQQSFTPNQNVPRLGDAIGFTNGQPYNYYNQNGSYQNMMYNSMYNPYEQERLRKEREEQQKQQALNRLSIMNKFDRNLASYVGQEIEQQTPEEQLKDIQSEYVYLQELQAYKDEHSGFDMEGFHLMSYEREMVPDSERQKTPEDVDPVEWMNNMGYMIAEGMAEELKYQKNNLAKAYNSQNYNQLLNMHNKSYDPYTATSIDDMEVRLPSEMNTEYQKRRQRFMQALMEG